MRDRELARSGAGSSMLAARGPLGDGGLALVRARWWGRAESFPVGSCIAVVLDALGPEGPGGCEENEDEDADTPNFASKYMSYGGDGKARAGARVR